MSVPEHVIGFDLSDRTGHFCVVNARGEVLEEGQVSMTEKAVRKRFKPMATARIAVEVGTHSPWVSRTLEECGHEVVVANARQLPLIFQGRRKSDRVDAENLARLARFDPKLLAPVQHRGRDAQADLAVVRSRDALVRARVDLINHVRGTVKSYGARLPGSSTHYFHKRAMEKIPEALRPALSPVVEAIGEITQRIDRLEKTIEKKCERYPETELLRQVHGVGILTALTFVLVLEDPGRFSKSRTIGSFLGLTPRQKDSGEREPQLRITKAGDEFLRRLLVGAAQHILGPFGADSDLRRWGLTLAARGGKNAKKRAVVAVARKLAVLLHKLWRSSEVYEPLRNSLRQEERGKKSA